MLEEPSRVHNIFYISQPHKYIPNPTHMIESESLQLKEDLTYEEQSFEIFDRQEK